MKEASVIVCETQFLSRVGLKTIINNHPFYKVIAEATDQDDLEQKISNTQANIVTLDYSYEGKFSGEAISMIQETSPNTKILIISNEQNKRNIYDVLGRGISQYITKYCRQDEIIMALDACRNDERYYCSKVLDIIMSKTFSENVREPIQLTQREEEIVKLIAQGKIAKEISSMLNVSIHTIYTHRKNIMKKLKISSPVELITYAISNGLVEL